MKVISCQYQPRYGVHRFKVQVDVQDASARAVLEACQMLPDTDLLQKVPVISAVAQGLTQPDPRWCMELKCGLVDAAIRDFWIITVTC